MNNFIAFIICTIATIIQWNNSWWAVGVCGILAVLNLIFAIQWVVKQIRNRKTKRGVQYMRTFKEILREVTSACDSVLYSGCKVNYKEIIECATRIYLAEMRNSKEEK